MLYLSVLENALKDTIAFPVQIVVGESVVEVVCKGETLDHPLSCCTQLFVKYILLIVFVRKHGFVLTYTDRDGKNIFQIHFK